jgi:phosphonate transport system substrate-binding protein
MSLLRSTRYWRLFVIFALCWVSPTAWAETLHLGTIGQSPADEIKDFLPLAKHLATTLKGEGVNDVKVVVAGSVAEMAALTHAAKVDLFIDSPFPSMAVNQLTGSKFLLRRWKRGVGEYRAVIFTRKDSGLRQLADLRGKIIAFEEPFSSTGYFFPKLALLQAGLHLAEKKEASDPVPIGKVGHVFTNGDENTMLWVLRGRVSAGAIDDVSFVKKARSRISELEMVYASAPMPRQFVNHRQGLTDNLIIKIRETLLSMDKTEAGRKTLADFQQTAKFDRIPDQFDGLVSKTAPFLRRELGLK